MRFALKMRNSKTNRRHMYKGKKRKENIIRLKRHLYCFLFLFPLFAPADDSSRLISFERESTDVGVSFLEDRKNVNTNVNAIFIADIGVGASESSIIDENS
jgi:hypothetical protein